MEPVIVAVPKTTSKKRVRLFILISMALALLSTYTVIALRKPLPQLTAATKPLTFASSKITEPAWPAGIQAAVGSDTKLLAQSSQTEPQVPFASINKVITALAIIKKKPITRTIGGVQSNDFKGELITFTANDEAIYNSYVAKGGSVVRVRAGDQLTQYQALQAMLMASGNNYADSLVFWAFGSMETYTAYANAMLREYGINNTIVKEASGFDDLSISTATDIIKIGQKLMADQNLNQIVGLNEVNLPNVGKIYNTNELIIKKSAYGIKTGHTVRAGYCMLLAEPFYAEGGKMNQTLLSVVLGTKNSQESFSLSSQLVNEFWTKNYGDIEVVKAGSSVGVYITPWGESVDIVTKDAVNTQGAKFEKRELITNTEKIPGNSTKGMAVGYIQGRNFLLTKPVPLLLETDIPAPSLWWRLTNYF